MRVSQRQSFPTSRRGHPEDWGSTQQHPEIMDVLRSLGAGGRVLSTRVTSP